MWWQPGLQPRPVLLKWPTIVAFNGKEKEKN